MLLAYAGPASSVRVEHASRDCFKNGGALAELMSLCEDTNQRNFEHLQDRDGGVAGEGHGPAIKVFFCYFGKHFVYGHFGCSSCL